jgi:hypothetical protein
MCSSLSLVICEYVLEIDGTAVLDDLNTIVCCTALRNLMNAFMKSLLKNSAVTFLML